MPRTKTTGGVGKSYRTLAKHSLMDKLIGKTMGACLSGAMLKHGVSKVVALDHSAGDGAVGAGEVWYRHCSPGLLAYHGMYLSARTNVPVTIKLYEQKFSTYERLLANLARELPKLNNRYAAPWTRVNDNTWMSGTATLVTYCADGATADISSVDSATAVLCLNDPNAMNTWPLSESFPAELAYRTDWWCMISTMGCNANGIKAHQAKELGIRKGWKTRIIQQAEAMPGHHDLYLTAIEKDAHQWAYLVQWPGKWRDDLEDACAKSFTGIKVCSAWGLREVDAFVSILTALFLTKKEIEDGVTL